MIDKKIISKNELFQLEKITREMEDWFILRTNNHIDLVRKYCERIQKVDEKKFLGLELRGINHDTSKFLSLEFIPYIFITWDYKCKNDKVPFLISNDMKERMNQATNHHVKTNRHHPEYWAEEKVDLINREDRDKPLTKIINVTQMPLFDISEMVADWCAMSEEKKTYPKDWADKNIGKRWNFNSEQIELIYFLISKIF